MPPEQSQNEEQDTDRLAKKMYDDGMIRSMAEGRRIVGTLKDKGLFPEKLEELYKRHGKEFKDEVP